MHPALSLSVTWALIFVAQIPMVAVYLLRLTRDPLYGWWPLFLLLCGAIVFGWQWDRQLRYPGRLLPMLWLALGISAALGAAWLQADWLAGFGLCCTATSFLATHRHLDGTQLTPIAFLTWGVLRLPLGGNAWLTQEFTLRLEHGVASTLRLMEVPHLHYFGAFKTVQAKYYVDELVYSSWGWPLFVALGLLYSAYLKRTWFEALLNGLSALGWCFVFHCGLLWTYVTYAIPLHSWIGWSLACGWATAVSLLFLSTERGMRILLMPISESSAEASLVNPFILAWNWFFSHPRRRKTPSSDGDTWSHPLMVKGALVVLGLTLLSQLIQAPRALATLRHTRGLDLNAMELEKFVFKNGEQFDYRRTVHAPPLVLNEQVDVWTVHAPLATTEHILFTQPRSLFDLNLVIEKQGWRVVEQDLKSVTLPDGQPLNYGRVTLDQGTLYVQLLYAWLGSDGQPLDPTTHSASGHLLISRSELVELCHVTASAKAGTLFSRFVVGVQNQLIPTASAK